MAYTNGDSADTLWYFFEFCWDMLKLFVTMGGLVAVILIVGYSIANFIMK